MDIASWRPARKTSVKLIKVKRRYNYVPLHDSIWFPLSEVPHQMIFKHIPLCIIYLELIFKGVPFYFFPVAELYLHYCLTHTSTNNLQCDEVPSLWVKRWQENSSRAFWFDFQRDFFFCSNLVIFIYKSKQVILKVQKPQTRQKSIIIVLLAFLCKINWNDGWQKK